MAREIESDIGEDSNAAEYLPGAKSYLAVIMKRAVPPFIP
jgi:hypothetical protein